MEKTYFCYSKQHLDFMGMKKGFRLFMVIFIQGLMEKLLVML